MPLHFSSVSLAIETTFGSLTAAGDVDPTGLSYLTTRADRVDVLASGDPTVNEDSRGRSGPWSYPGWPSTTYTGTPGFAPRVRRMGAISLKLPWFGYGTRADGPAAHPIHMCLSSVLADTDTPVVTSDTVEGVTTSTLTPTADGSTYRTGDLFGFRHAGTYEVAGITRAVAGAGGLTVSPALPDVLAAATPVRAMRSLYLANDMVCGTAAERAAQGRTWPNTLAVRLDGIDDDRQPVRVYAVGCRLQSAKLTFVDRLAMWDITLLSPYIFDDNANGAPADAPDHDGPPLHLLGSRVLVTDPVTGIAPEALARNALNVNADGVEFSLEVEPRQLGATESALGCYEVEPSNVRATLTLPLSQYIGDLDRDMWDRVQRGALLTLAPGDFQGAGGAIYMPCGVQTADLSRRPQVLTLTQGRSQGDLAGGPAANSAMRIGFGL